MNVFPQKKTGLIIKRSLTTVSSLFPIDLENRVIKFFRQRPLFLGFA